MCLRKCQVCGSYFIPWETYSYFILLIFKLSAAEKSGVAPKYSILSFLIMIIKISYIKVGVHITPSYKKKEDVEIL